jgi:hypothetical protein
VFRLIQPDDEPVATDPLADSMDVSARTRLGEPTIPDARRLRAQEAK